MRGKIRSKRHTPLGSVYSANKLFSKLNVQELRALDEIKRIETFEKGVFIYRQGEASEHVYILLEGRAQFANSISGSTPRMIRRNEICGIVEALSNGTYLGDLKTLAPCIFGVIGQADLVSFLNDEAKVCFRLTRLISLDYQELISSVRHLVDCEFEPGKELHL